MERPRPETRFRAWQTCLIVGRIQLELSQLSSAAPSRPGRATATMPSSGRRRWALAVGIPPLPHQTGRQRKAPGRGKRHDLHPVWRRTLHGGCTHDDRWQAQRQRHQHQQAPHDDFKLDQPPPRPPQPAARQRDRAQLCTGAADNVDQRIPRLLKAMGKEVRWGAHAGQYRRGECGVG